MGGSRGKLRAAARWLVKPAAAADADEDEQADESLRRLGVAAEEIEQARRERSTQEAARAAEQMADPLVVWAWHLDAVHLFIGMRSQWRVAVLKSGALLYTGLDLAALPAVQQNLGVAPGRDVFEQLETMARAACRTLNEGL